MNTRTSYTMKAVFLIVLVVSVVTIITSCDFNLDHNQDQWAPINVTDCFKVLDASSNSPLDSAYIRITVKAGIYYNPGGTTDASGNCCIEHKSGELTELVVIKQGYVTFWSRAPIPRTVQLTPAAFLQIRVTNVPPSDVNDQIGITYPDVSLNGSSLSLFYGDNVDTTFTSDAPPGLASVSWISWHNNIRTDSAYNNISLRSHDTTRVHILY